MMPRPSWRAAITVINQLEMSHESFLALPMLVEFRRGQLILRRFVAILAAPPRCSLHRCFHQSLVLSNWLRLATRADPHNDSH
jgi:hypothetical protein